ncbi:MAG: coenzyme F420-0:L-glutamate ligase [Candidatus Promineifilaceae bacterium]
MTTVTEPGGHSSTIRLTAIPGIPEVRKGDRISTLLLDGLEKAGIKLIDRDIIAITHKVISKAEGRLVNLDDVTPGSRAREIAVITDKDPKLVQMILTESTGISRMRNGVLIVRHRLGFTSANAGIDRSNVPQNGAGEWVILLPINPDSSAAQIGGDILDRCGVNVGILIVDSHGRPFRLGTVGVAIGVSGIPALWDRRGESDLYGYHLEHTEVGTADEIAAAASILMGQASEGQPAILIRGLNLPPLQGKARDLVRSKELDLYR